MNRIDRILRIMLIVGLILVGIGGSVEVWNSSLSWSGKALVYGLCLLAVVYISVLL